jgi:phosphatidate phosphatase APP1
MADWQRPIARWARKIERPFDRLKYRFGTWIGGNRPLKINAYQGYGTAERFYLKGRVLEDKELGNATQEDGSWRNFVRMFHRFASNEIPGATVKMRFEEQEETVVTDEEGYYEHWLTLESPPPPERFWHDVELTLLAPQRHDERIRATGQVMVPPSTARFGVISDLDDTVIHTDATSLFKMARIVLLGNFHTRLPFAGVAAFYQALQAGTSGNDMNPLFYVSSSPWNIFDMLHDFLDIQGIPPGPLKLRDWGLTEVGFLPTGHKNHKIAAISQIMDLYPHLSFILIGDSGQEDPEIYAEIVEAYPDRIAAVYIRNVSLKHVTRPEAIRRLAKDVRRVGSDLLLVDDTYTAALHAVEKGWIHPDVLPAIQADTAEDQAAPLDAELDIVEESKDRAVQLEPGTAQAIELAKDEEEPL